MSPEIGKLLKIIEQKLDWGESSQWQSRDFENLNQLIFNETGVSLSASTLRRIWGHVAYKHLPSTTTLDALAKFAGFETWRKFTRSNLPVESVPEKENAPVRQQKSRNFSKIILIIAVVITASLISIFAGRTSKRPIQASDYSLSFRAVTRGVPNSVIFTYDATASPTDSVYIQQSWDPEQRVHVDKLLHKHTSVYYNPGFHRAKLIIGDSIVKEQKLIIPTNGWLGLIDQKPIPVYLHKEEFLGEDFLRLPANEIEKKNIPLEPKPAIVRYSNVGNFEPVSVKNFSFSSDIKNEYREGAGACQFSFIILITDDVPIIIPICAKGCVSEVSVWGVDTMISGKKADLSGFGSAFSDWVNVACKSSGSKLQFLIDGKTVLEVAQPKKETKIVGISYGFQGTGAVKNINLAQGDKTIFHAF